MGKYTYEDVMFNPESKEVNDCIGKVVYFANSPTDCLNRANEDNENYCGTLYRIKEGDSSPFIIISHDSDCPYRTAASIILKKDLPPKYIEFKNLDEFSRAYDESCKHVKSDSIGGRLIKAGGVWLIREKTKINSFYQVGYLYDNGLKVLGWGDVGWEDLFRTFTFLDKSPCGKKI